MIPGEERHRGWRTRARAARVIALRDLSATLRGQGIWAVLSVSFILVSYLSVGRSLWAIGTTGIVPMQNPFEYPLLLITTIASGYLTFCCMVGIARDRDEGTLEILFYGPVDAASYVAGKYIQAMLAFLVAAACAAGYCLVASLLTNLTVSSHVLQLIVLSFFTGSVVIAFGILLSIISRRLAGSIALFIGLMLIFVLIDAAHRVVLLLPVEQMSSGLVQVRVLLETLNDFMDWVSPPAYLRRGHEALQTGHASQYVISVLSCVVYTLMLLVGAGITLRHKGVGA